MSRTTHSQSEAVVTSADLLADAKALCDKITAMVGPAAKLTQADYRRSTKLRKGGQGALPTIVALAEQTGLVVPSHPTKTIVEKMDLAESLVPLHKQLVIATKQIGDALFLAQSQSWSGATVHYTMLRRLAKKDGDLARALAPVIQFFAARSTAVQAEEKAKRGGARKGTKKPKASLPPADAARNPAESGGAAAQTQGTPASTGTSPPAASTNGAAH
jgi:hypothetical protein